MEADATNLRPWERAGHHACARRIAQLEAENTALRARLDKIEQLLADRDRGAKRQAAPFSKGSPCAEPKTPGRKPGEDYGTKAFRAVPAPEQIDESYEAPLPQRCPRCGAGTLIATAQHDQYQAELPQRPIFRRFRVAVGQCTCCGKKVRGRHPLQTSDAVGCCASQLGPAAQALAVILNKKMGLSYGKAAQLLSQCFQLPVTAGGVCQALLRVAQRTQAQRDEIVQQLSTSPWLVPDETGWRVGGGMAWLHTAVAINATAYLVHPRRGYEAARKLIPANYTGTLVHDGWAPYDRFTQAGHQTCLAHLLRRCAELLEMCQGNKGAAGVVPQKIKALLQEALIVRDRRDAGAITAQAAVTAGVKLQQQMSRLTGTTKSHAGNERLCKHLWKHQDQLFTFLAQPGIDATNYRAEQAIRPAVVNRKVWGGNRTEHGAWAQGVLLTVLETLSRRGADVAQWLNQALRQWPRPLPLPAMLASG